MNIRFSYLRRMSILILGLFFHASLAKHCILHAQSLPSELATADNNKAHSQIFSGNGIESIPDRLAKSKGNITVKSGNDREMGEGRDGTEPAYPPIRLVDLACYTDAVVVAAPINGVSHMNADKDFIYSDWTMRVADVLQDTLKTSIIRGQTINVVRPGGQITIDGRTVYGEALDFPAFNKDAKYLIFMTFIPQTGAFKVRTERTFDLSPDHGPYSNSHSAAQFISSSPDELLRDTRAAIAYAAGLANCKKEGDQ